MGEIPYLDIIEDLKDKKEIIENGIEAFIQLYNVEKYQLSNRFKSVQMENEYDRGMGIGYY